MTQETTIIPATTGVDNSTIEYNGSNQLTLKDDGITTAKIQDGAITNAKIALTGVKEVISAIVDDVSLGNVSSGTYYSETFSATNWKNRQLRLLFEVYQISSGGGTRQINCKVAGNTLFSFGNGTNPGTAYVYEVILTKTREAGTGSQTILWQYRILNSTSSWAMSSITMNPESDFNITLDMTSSYTGGTHSTTFRWLDIESL